MRTVLWPAILDASMLDPPTSCRHVILARRKECGPRPGKSQPSASRYGIPACAKLNWSTFSIFKPQSGQRTRYNSITNRGPKLSPGQVSNLPLGGVGRLGNPAPTCRTNKPPIPPFPSDPQLSSLGFLVN